MDISDSTAELLAITNDFHDRYQIKTDISLSDFNNFIVGESTEEDVISKVGAPNDVYGSGYIGDRYYTKDGYDIVVYYYAGAVEQIRCINTDGTYTVLK